MDKQLFQDAGRYVLAWTMRHKVAAVIIVLLFVFLFWPKNTPKLRGVEAKAETPNEQPGSPSANRPPASTTQPASTQPVTAQRAGDLPLYAPDAEGADPTWSLPAELKAGDLQRLARQVDKLSRDIPATAQLEMQCNAGVGELFTGEFVQLFWSRLMGQGFHDANLPLDWYEVVKERNSLLGSLAAMAEIFTNQLVQNTIALRLTSRCLSLLSVCIRSGQHSSRFAGLPGCGRLDCCVGSEDAKPIRADAAMLVIGPVYCVSAR